MTSETFAPSLEETLQALAELSPIDYEQIREEKAKELKFRVSVLDAEVEKRRPQQDNDKQQGRSVTLKSPEPWEEPVNGDAMIKDIGRLLARYIVAPKSTLVVIVFWVVHTHAFRTAVHSPRLNITAPEKGCGKTLVLDILEHLTPKAVRTENLSSAVMFRLVDGQQPTLLIDEYDSFLRDSEDLRGALNAGWQRGGQHLRCEGDKNEVRAFRTFAPVALAGIKGLPSTLHDRSILIRMKRATWTEVAKVEHFDSRHTEELDILCRQVARWAADNVANLQKGDPKMPEGFFNRVADRWRHLFAVADVVGGSWPAKLREIAQAFERQEGQESLGVMLLEDIRSLFTSGDRLTSEAVVEGLHKLDDRPWSEYGRTQKPITKAGVGRLLNGYGIKSKSLWISGETHRGYEISQFIDAFNRYLATGSNDSNSEAQDTPAQSVRVLGANKNKELDENKLLGGHDDLTLSNAEKPLENNTPNKLTLSEPPPGLGRVNGYPTELFDAATKACSGLRVTAGAFIADLDPADYQDIIDDPRMARYMAQQMERGQ